LQAYCGKRVTVGQKNQCDSALTMDTSGIDDAAVVVYEWKKVKWCRKIGANF
jgi:hypothetical protein